MNEKMMSIREFLAKYDAGKFNSSDCGTMIDAGWHDWFCEDSELKPRLDGLVLYFRQILPSPKIGIDRNYVWFKNIVKSSSISGNCTEGKTLANG
jgi:hypothetical protein